MDLHETIKDSVNPLAPNDTHKPRARKRRDLIQQLRSNGQGKPEASNSIRTKLALLLELHKNISRKKEEDASTKVQQLNKITAKDLAERAENEVKSKRISGLGIQNTHNYHNKNLRKRSIVNVAVANETRIQYFDERLMKKRVSVQAGLFVNNYNKHSVFLCCFS